MLGVDPTKVDDDFKITRFWMEGGRPMFEFNHSADGAGKSFVSRLKVKGMNLVGVGVRELGESADCGDPSFRFFTVEVAFQ